ncbi:MAG: 16S rRNA (cytosine(967)-C(5))-methyltransferase RsmB, partial [Selenomonadaceae bacterium]|nr:16S rRNA (cytosine(967)-C(5))-methyltransferase RsmB [Selenomonadaceae bacterium]
MDKARHTAVAVIHEVMSRGAYANITLAKALRTVELRDIDRRFCTELVNGTIKCGTSLDWIISKFINRPLRKVDPKILAILRAGVYQLFFLDRVPESAAINESVEIAKVVSVGSSKFVNGVLRSMTRDRQKATFPTDDSPASLALRTFHPKWLVERWIDQFGLEQTKILLDVDNRPAPITLRVN